MHQRTRELLRAFLRGFEGIRTVMYLDQDGYVTTGVGFLINSIPAAQGLPWYNREARRAATPAEVAAEWRRISTGGNPNASPLRLGQGVINRHFDRMIDRREAMLQRCFSGFATFPDDAQLGMLAHSWLASSCQGIRGGYPEYYAACGARDWDRAGPHSLWRRLREALQRGQPERRVNRARAMLRMFENAAVVEEARRRGLGVPDGPFYPRDAAISYPQVQADRARERDLRRRYGP